MKMASFLLIVYCLSFFEAHSQNSNPCGKSWSDWQIGWNFSYGRVLFRLEFPSKSCGCGYNFVQMQHNIPYRVRLSLRLEGVNCDGKNFGERFDADIEGGTISNDRGDYHWFKSMPTVIKVEVDFEDGKNRVKLVGDKSGTKTYINGMSEDKYNQLQKQSSSGALSGSPSVGASKKIISGTAEPAIVFPHNESPVVSTGNINTRNPSTGSNTTNKGVNTSHGDQESIRRQKEEEIRRQKESAQKEKEEEERKRQEAWRREQERYEAQLNEITRKSEARAQTHAAISQGFGAFFSALQQINANKALENANKRRSNQLQVFKNELAKGSFELIDCNICHGDGYLNCFKCKTQGKNTCLSCSGMAGKACEVCRGTGKQQWGTYTLSCTNCSGTGQRQCISCNNTGESICGTCYGMGEMQCDCNGTGKQLKGKGSSISSKPPAADNISDRDIGQENIDADKKILNGLSFSRKPDLDAPDSVYYIFYKRLYKDNIFSPVNLALYKVYRYSDGTYPLMSSVYQKIKMEPFISGAGTCLLVGYYQNQADMSRAIEQISERARQQGIQVNSDKNIKVINARQNQMRDDDFWNH